MKALFSALCISGVVATLASNNVSLVDLGYYADFDQSGPFATPEVRTHFHETFLVTSGPGVFDSVGLQRPQGTQDNLSSFFPTQFEQRLFFPSQADLEQAFPAGGYLFSGVGGSDGPSSGELLFPALLWQSERPEIDGSTYSDLVTKSAGTEIMVRWNQYKVSGDGVTTTFILEDLTANTGVAFDRQPLVFDSFVIPGADRKPGHRYLMQVWFAVTDNVFVGGFPSADGEVTFHHRTFAPFAVPADPGTVAGRINLEGFPFAFGEPVQLEILDSNGTVAESVTTILGNGNYFAHQTSLRGTRLVRFKAKTWLSQSVSVDLDSGFGDVDLTLKNGDIDGDNTVTIFDYIALSENFDEAFGEPTWDTPSGSGFSAQDCDLDRDGLITIFDYILLSGNFDESGS
mgnify:CR=1 FL=1